MAQQIERFEQRYRNLYTVESQHYDFHRFTNPQGQAFHSGEQRVIWDLLKLQLVQRMLDVAAGTGRIAAYLAEQGLVVVAFDLTPICYAKRVPESIPLPLTISAWSVAQGASSHLGIIISRLLSRSAFCTYCLLHCSAHSFRKCGVCCVQYVASRWCAACAIR